MSITSVITSKKSAKNSLEKPNNDIGNELVREKMISDAAYFRAEKRGFKVGDSMGDWLVSEAEIDDVLRNN